jgi:hypothetical protein
MMFRIVFWDVLPSPYLFNTTVPLCGNKPKREKRKGRKEINEENHHLPRLREWNFTGLIAYRLYICPYS